ncbi:beta-ketoacyl synthase domain-containing protein [Lasallia pustulata]|uniref:Beta-ketoacyl synthase domain-containing protein n=1 Tax=Lasallia pustulata TaxID=136370 RepID=A0A1W5D9N6_9LECA|nr:beta-ketoacyl synthase domain-containing protein [Lasallia pustulata]
MNYEQWQAAVAPKIQGTWNLHNALLAQETPLDFFFLFSSVSGMYGQFGHANYACANTFLDAFIQYRQSQHLPASTIDIGVVEEIGYLSRNRDILEAQRATSTHILREQDLLDSLQLMIHHSHSPLSISSASTSASRSYINPGQISLGLRSTLPMSAPNNRTAWRRGPRMSMYGNLEVHDLATGATNASESLKQFLRDAASNPSSLGSEAFIALLAAEFGKMFSGFTMMGEEQMDLTTSLAALGVDSLIRIELRNWSRQKLGVEFTILELVGATSIMQLGKLAGKKVIEKYEARA